MSSADYTADMFDPALLTAIVVVPEHVAFRAFPTETVMLNLQSGQYHGLNATAGSFIEHAQQGRTVEEAAVAVAEEYAASTDRVRTEMCALVGALVERGLIEIRHNPR